MNARLHVQLYSRLRGTVNAGRGAAAVLGLILAGSPSAGTALLAQPNPLAPATCTPELAARFAPPRPRLGRYEVCTTPAPLASLAGPDWPVEAMVPADAFGAAGSYDRGALARLYRGRLARVARGWQQRDGRFEATTLVSPHPDAGFTQLLEGTLIIRVTFAAAGDTEPRPE